MYTEEDNATMHSVDLWVGASTDAITLWSTKTVKRRTFKGKCFDAILEHIKVDL